MMYLGDQAIGLNHTFIGIGQAAAIETGNYTPTEDIAITDAIINHSLGTIPDFIIVFVEPFSLASYNTSYFVSGSYYAPFDLRYSTYYYVTAIYTQANTTSNGSTYGGILKANAVTETTFTFPHTSSSTSTLGRVLKANLTYHYVLGKFNTQEVTANV